MTTVSVLGLGKLGLPMAAVFAYKGHNVIGCDMNEGLVNKLVDGECPINEPWLDGFLKEAWDKQRLSVTTDARQAVIDSAMSFVIVPTPSDGNGEFSNEYVEAACRQIAQGLKFSDTYHLVVIVSTVMPGTMANVVKPLLESESGLKCGTEFGLCYNPEFVALGSVIADMKHPDAFLIGESDEIAGAKLEAFQRTVSDWKEVPVSRMSFWNAEVAKLMLNVYVTTKISLANTFADVCERIPGGNVDVVTEFLGHDKRIGPTYLKGGLGFSGTCFPRDNRAFIAMADKLQAFHLLQEATDVTNTDVAERIADRIRDLVDGDGIVAILGVTYKPNTNVIEDSSILEVVDCLLDARLTVNLYDPQGLEAAKDSFTVAAGIQYFDSKEDCLAGADVAVLATAWSEFKELKPRHFKTLMRKPVLFDCWRFYDKAEFVKAGVEYHAVGVSDD